MSFAPMAIATAMATVLGQGTALESYRYIPFLRPLPVWQDWAWPWLLLPLCAGVALVYKSIRVPDVKRVPREAAAITLWILFGMAAAAAVLALLVKVMERA